MLVGALSRPFKIFISLKKTKKNMKLNIQYPLIYIDQWQYDKLKISLFEHILADNLFVHACIIINTI